MYIRKTEAKDLEKIDIMILKAKKNMRDVLKIDQWQAGYPNRSIYEKDIADGISYVLCDDNDEVQGVCALIFDGEPLYDSILTGNGEFPGRWQSNGPHCVIHRICVDADKNGEGLGTVFARKIMKMAIAKGCSSIRVDTHRGNLPMRGMLKKNGFVETGVIFIPEPHTNERITYERLL